jgi:hypothetical protein
MTINKEKVDVTLYLSPNLMREFKEAIALYENVPYLRVTEDMINQHAEEALFSYTYWKQHTREAHQPSP